MPEIINLEDKFNEWFHEHEGFSTRSERFYESLEQFSNKEALVSSLVLLVKAAYLHGVRTAVQDSCDTLRDYATALAGCPAETKTPTASYDEAAKSLLEYWSSVFNQGEYND